LPFPSSALLLGLLSCRFSDCVHLPALFRSGDLGVSPGLATVPAPWQIALTSLLVGSRGLQSNHPRYASTATESTLHSKCAYIVLTSF
jgi:hypothetical protein